MLVRTCVQKSLKIFFTVFKNFIIYEIRGIKYEIKLGFFAWDLLFSSWKWIRILRAISSVCGRKIVDSVKKPTSPWNRGKNEGWNRANYTRVDIGDTSRKRMEQGWCMDDRCKTCSAIDLIEHKDMLDSTYFRITYARVAPVDRAGTMDWQVFGNVLSRRYQFITMQAFACSFTF